MTFFTLEDYLWFLRAVNQELSIMYFRKIGEHQLIVES